MFDAAGQAEAKGDLAGALAGYQAIEPRLGAKNARSRAIVRVREGGLLFQLGRLDEAEAALTAGLAGLPADEPSLREDRAAACQDLGDIALARFDPAAAVAGFDQALTAASPGNQRLLALAGRAKARQFLDPAAALVDVDAALAEATGGKASKATLGQVMLLRGRILLTKGDKAAARQALDRAVAQLGGLTTKVDLADVAARNDLGMAEMLGGDPDLAHKYLAYAAAGHLDKPFVAGADMAPPPCGLTGLAPDDMAVVEFTLADDGSVRGAQPVYANRIGPKAYEFARAVQGWSWTPEQVAEIKPFFRHMIRVEIRCSTGAEHGAVLAALRGDVQAWLNERGVAPVELSGVAAVDAAALRVELARREHGKPVTLLPVLAALGESPVLAATERARFAQRAEQIATAEHAPPPAMAFYAISASNAAGEAGGAAQAVRVRAARARARELLAQPMLAADPRTAAALKLLIAEAHYGVPLPADATTLLRSVADDERLAKDDALRIGALTRLASLAAQAGDLVSARADYARSGLTDQQCALVDAQPAMRSSGASSAAFPQEALRWGFEGWAVAQFDVRADGRTANQRIVAAYPPLVFDDATTGIARVARYTQTFRPEGGLGCSGATARYRFMIPH